VNTTKHKLTLGKGSAAAPGVAGVGAKRQKWAPGKAAKPKRSKVEAGGAACVLKSRKQGSTDYGYPICNTAGRMTCQGTQTAFQRAKRAGDAGVAKQAKRKGRELQCGWALKRRK